MSKKRIMIDMDDCLVGGGLISLINDYLGTNYQEEDAKGFYLQDLVPDKEQFFQWFLTQNMYTNGVIKENAISVIKELNDAYEVYLCTAYFIPEIPTQCGLLLKQKFEFLVENLSFINPYNFVFLNNKKIFDCEIKIDDNLKNLEGAEIKLLFTAYHNKEYSDEYLKENGIIRVNSWLDVKKILLG